MDLQALETLEERVNKAVEVIAGLKNDKKKLEAENKALQDELNTVAHKLKSAENRGNELAGLKAENQRLSATQAEIRKRLEDIISKLEKYKD